MLERKVQDPLGECEVVFHHVSAVGQRGVRARALMEDDLDRLAEALRGNRRQKFIGLHEVGETQVA